MSVFSPQLNLLVKPRAKQHALANGYIAAMDVHEIRRRNLKTLVARLKLKLRTQKATALALGLSESFLSQLLGGKLMGSEVARKIESSQELPSGWMDLPRWNTNEEPADYAESHVAGLDLRIIGQAVKLLRLVLPITGDPIELASDPECIVEAYSIVARALEARQSIDDADLVKLGAPLANWLRDRKTG